MSTPAQLMLFVAPLGTTPLKPRHEYQTRRLPLSTRRCGATPDRHQTRASLSPTALGPFPSVNPLAIGTWAWGNQVLFNYTPSDDERLQQAFNAAVTRGVNLIDTADSYGTLQLNARAEKLLGRFLAECPIPTNDVLIATKFASYPWRLTPQSIADAAARSAERLGRPVDLGQVHWSASRYAPWQERALWDGVALAREKGYIREVGVSNFGPVMLRRVERYLREERGVRLATVQTQLSLLYRRPVEDGLLQTARELGVGIIGYSPLCLGLLTGKYRGDVPKGLRGVLFGRVLKGSDALVDKLCEIGERKGGWTAGQVAVAWCLAQGVVVLTGVRESRHVEESVAAGDLMLTKDECLELERVARAGPQMIANSFQTD